MPEGWQSESVGNLSTIVKRGRAPAYSDTGLLVLGQKCIRDGRVALALGKRTDTSVRPVPNWALLRAGDVLVNSTGAGTLGRVGFLAAVPEPMTADSHVAIVRPDPRKVSPAYLGLALNMQEPDLVALQSGSTKQTELSPSALSAIRVALPPLAEQHRIVRVMRQVEDTLALSDAATRRSSGLVDALREDWFRRMWASAELRPLGEVVERVRRPIQVLAKAAYSEIGIRSHGRGIFHKETVTGADLGAKGVFGIEPGDLVLNIVFAWERAVAVAGPEDAGRCGSHRFPTYRPLNGVAIDYVCQALLSSRGASLLGLASPGSAGRNRTLSQASLLQSPIPVPSLAEQKSLVRLLAAARNAARAQERHRAAAAQLRMSLLAALMTGTHQIPDADRPLLGGAS